jgi:hypothetical protein
MEKVTRRHEDDIVDIVKRVSQLEGAVSARAAATAAAAAAAFKLARFARSGGEQGSGDGHHAGRSAAAAQARPACVAQERRRLVRRAHRCAVSAARALRDHATDAARTETFAVYGGQCTGKKTDRRQEKHCTAYVGDRVRATAASRVLPPH